MDDDSKGAIAAALAIGVIVLIFLAGAWGVGWSQGANRERDRAIEAGAGAWTINPKTGERKFEYRTCNEAEPDK